MFSLSMLRWRYIGDAGSCLIPLLNRSCRPSLPRSRDRRTGPLPPQLFRVSSKFRLTAVELRHIDISMKLEKAALQLEALGNPTRLQLYRTLVRAGDEAFRSVVSRTSLASPPRRCRIISNGCRYRPRDTGTAGDDSDLPRELCRHGRADRLSRRRMLRRRACPPASVRLASRPGVIFLAA